MSDMEAKENNRLWWLGLTFVLVVGLMAFIAALASPWGTGYGMMGWGWGWGVLMMAVPVVVLVLILLVVSGAFAPRTATPAYVPPVSPPSSATEILDARYARGEISREEYLRVRADLEGRPR